MSRILVPFALSTLVATMLFLAASAGEKAPAVLRPEPVSIAVEHALPLRLFVALSEGKRPAMAEFSHDGTENAALSLPSTWVLRAVRGAAIKDVPSEIPSLGFTRWTIPPRAVLSFIIPSPPVSLILLNPSRIQMQVSLKRISLSNASATSDVFLLQDDSLRLY